MSGAPFYELIKPLLELGEEAAFSSITNPQEEIEEDDD